MTKYIEIYILVCLIKKDRTFFKLLIKYYAILR